MAAKIKRILQFLRKVTLKNCQYDQFSKGILMETLFYLKEQKKCFKKNALPKNQWENGGAGKLISGFHL